MMNLLIFITILVFLIRTGRCILKYLKDPDRKKAGWLQVIWKSIVGSNNLDPIWIGFLFILCFFATIAEIGSFHFQAPLDIKEQYIVEKSVEKMENLFLGEDSSNRADEWLSQQPAYPFPKRERRFYRLFAGWLRTFFVLVLFIFSIPWAFHDEVHGFFAKRLEAKKKAGGEKGFSATEMSLMALVFTEVTELFHMLFKSKNKKGA